MANRYRGTLYTGVTADIAARMMQHRGGTGSRFAAKYGVSRLVHVEYFERIEDAIAREKAIKKWRRDWKIELIERGNPDWADLFDTLNC
ncbi:GIY-YIG nuclease family protein [Sphingomonas sp. KR3-1]|uniref:GIY-YIG nuclease family protein n=1 Tax=Sphingomonas sp. KR3-1 TaxID=3156611 RepID=UPI0032B55082